MKRKIRYIFIILLIIGCKVVTSQTKNTENSHGIDSEQKRPTISFTFDDGITHNQAGYKFKDWNKKLLKSLDNANIRSVFFIKTGDKLNKKGLFLIESWNERGHKIANHTFSHPNFNKKSISVINFQTELLKADSIIRNYSNYIKLFRFPYLKEGNTQAKVDSIRCFLKDNGYRNGHVTIDASDWYIDSRLKKRLKRDPDADLNSFKEYYLSHLYERAMYYENLSHKLTGRHIKHTLLLHHNITASLFLDDLIKMFKSKGWDVISAENAFDDPIYHKVPKHAGESLVFSKRFRKI